MTDDELISEPEEQGLRLMDCFHCRLLYPDAPGTCPRCGGAMRFVPAQMMAGSLIRERVERALAEYARVKEGETDDLDKGPSRFDHLVGILELLHLYTPESLKALEGIGKLTLADLRRDYEDLQGEA